MNIITYASYNQIEPTHDISNHLTIVIDVLRATSSMIAALNNGAKSIFPVAKVSEAIAMRERHPTALLCGERKMALIEGFDLSNSPYDYTRQAVNNKELIYTTTNGTKALNIVSSSRLVTIASLQNVASITKLCKSTNLPIAIVMSGTGEMFSLDDAVCAGAIASSLEEAFEIDDLSLVCSNIFKYYLENSSLEAALLKSGHGKLMAKHGYLDDLKYCAQLNTIDIVPIYKNNILALTV